MDGGTITALLMLITGSINTISKKIMYSLKALDFDGDAKEAFKKPCLCTAFMFLGESSCLIAHAIGNWRNRRAGKPVADPTSGLGYPKFIACTTLFATLDLVSTTLTGIALLHISASVTQIMRGAVIAFTLLASWMLLKRRPTAWQVLGVFCALVGLGLVGCSAVFSDSDTEHHSGTEILIAILLVLCSQIFSSLQFVFEEMLLGGAKGEKRTVPPLFLVGWEGVCGFVLSAGVMLPVAHFTPGHDHNSYENFLNSIYMLRNAAILCTQLLYTFSIAFFNFFGLTLAKRLSSTHRTLIDALRTVCVWGVMVILFYAGTGLGESLSYWSILQVFGFVFMILGTVVHNNVANVGMKIFKKTPQADEYTLIQADDDKEADEE